MNKKKSIISNLIWKFAERIGAQFVSLIVSIVLAHYILPEQYGSISILLIFINIANVFVSEGFSTALVQKKNADELDNSTMFYCSLLISILLYVILFILAPCIADFYKMQELTWLLRILAIKLPIASINSIQHAYVARNMIFKKFFFSTLFGTILSGVVGIILAINGAGPWALVAQYLINSTVDTVVLFFIIDWKPRLLFSISRAKELLKYGWKITVGSLLNTIYNESRSLVIGKKYTSSSLAYYNKGVQFPQLIVTNIDSSIGSVLFPALCQYNNNDDDLKRIVRKSMRMSCYIIFPCMAGLAAISEPLIRLLLTDKWLSAAFFLQVACVTQALQPINTANIQMIKASGRSDLFLKMEIIKKISGLIILIVAMWFGVKVLACSEILVVVICNIVNAYPNKKLIRYGYTEQFMDIFPSAIISVGMFFILKATSVVIILPDILLIILEIALGFVIYLGCSVIFKQEGLKYLLNYIKKLKTKGHNN